MLHGGNGADKPVPELLSRRLPAWLDRVEFRGVFQEIEQPECTAVVLQKSVHQSAAVPPGVVRKKAHPAPTFLQFPQKPDIDPLVFLLREMEDECPPASCAKDVNPLVLVIEASNGAEALLCPAPYNGRQKAKRGLVLCGSYEPFLPVTLCQHRSLFLKWAIFAFPGAL